METIEGTIIRVPSRSLVDPLWPPVGPYGGSTLVSFAGPLSMRLLLVDYKATIEGTNRHTILSLRITWLTFSTFCSSFGRL